jgi:ERCC4-type nuclease
MKEIQRFILASIPGVNRTKADTLLEKFKTIKTLANAEPTDLVTIEGIGKTLTERILKILQEEANDSEHLD